MVVIPFARNNNEIDLKFQIIVLTRREDSFDNVLNDTLPEVRRTNQRADLGIYITRINQSLF